MTPADFRRFVEALADEAGIDRARIILGGDHLGPNPWKKLSAPEAMARACDMVKAYVEAGFEKIHLDASMACADDGALTERVIAERAAALCAVAEAAGEGGERVYVIGTEVPIPGGELGALDALAVTRPEVAQRTYDLHAHAFAARGVARAMDDVVAIVVQPGVDMGNTQVFQYDKAKAASLSAALAAIPGVVYEAHSTDFQTGILARRSGRHAFPHPEGRAALTFAFREAVFALAEIEARLAPAEPSRIVETLERVMDANLRIGAPMSRPTAPSA